MEQSSPAHHRVDPPGGETGQEDHHEGGRGDVFETGQHGRASMLPKA
ncbi:hypothetical protein ACFFX0_24820 [Citricoccus parietis]|uniref:Uncharacterized protein n=1 Tax=Citricoccus parietis TaxID=592307 RepID=A0ABV5G5Q0_9MICC